ncbi:sensor histidine kinase [Burkholderiaceae bacterium DAT-1]|nr:sensor histidine kinase [Burkholderiaceae bacterium DAT-1]
MRMATAYLKLYKWTIFAALLLFAKVGWAAHASDLRIQPLTVRLQAASEALCPGETVPQIIPSEATWWQIDIDADHDVRLLGLGVPDIEFASLYTISSGDTRCLYRLVPGSRYADRPWPSRMVQLPIPASTERTRYVLVWHAHANTPLALTLQTPLAAEQALSVDNLRIGLVTGCLLALFLLACMHYAIEQQPAYLYYAVTVACASVFLLQIGGFLFVWCWPDWGKFNQAVPVWLQVAIHCSHAAFTVHLFDLRRRAPWLWQAYLFVMLMTPSAALVFQLTGSLLLVYPMLAFYVPLPILAGAVAMRQRLPSARTYLAGALCMLVCVNGLFALSVMGILRDWPTFVFPQIGYLLEALCFAAAVGMRMFTLQRSHARQLEARLHEAEQLAQLEADKLELQQKHVHQQMEMAAAGHDLTQPIAAIRLAIPALRAQAGLTSVGSHIEQALNHTESLLRELMGQARSGHCATRLDLNEVLIGVYQRHRMAAEAKGLRLRYVDTSLDVVASDTVLLRLLDNLVGNAIRYTHSGGIVLGARRRGADIVLQVWDSGPGLPEVDRERLMRPFQQGGRFAQERQGYGLGLYIVRTLCEQSGYGFAIASRPGKGTVMSITVPGT